MEKYDWHPLYKPFCQVLDYYNKLATEKKSNRDFNAILAYLWDCYDGKVINDNIGDLSLLSLLKKFVPLIINCNNGLTLFKYKDYIALSDLGFGDEFWQLYDGMYLECRSVVMDVNTREIVLAPQSKFFNVNERAPWSEENIKRRINNARIVEISNKLDGSNQNYCYYNNTIIGSGSSAIDPLLSWRLSRGYELLGDNYKEMLRAYPNVTFMFEFIAPENQVVVHYDKSQEGLYLFGIRDNATGKQKTYEETLQIAHNYHVLTTEIYDDSFDDILGKLDDYSCEEKEGWVISILDYENNVFKAKLKVNDYVLMHRAISKLVSPNSIIQAIADNRWDDFFAKIPSGHKENAANIYRIVTNYVAEMNLKTIQAYQKTEDSLGDNFNNTKEFMLFVKDKYKNLMPYLIKMYKGQEINFLKKNSTGYKKLNELVINKKE